MTRSWARRSLAAETTFMALVICCVFFTERMRRRRSIKLGIRLGGYERFLVLGDETLLEFFDHRVELALELVVQSFLFADFLEQAGLRGVEEAVEFRFELPDVFDGQIVEQAVG